MKLSDQKPATVKAFRKRMIREEDLLHSRSSVFLITSGLLLTAFSISDYTTIRFIISFLGIIMTIFWALCSWQNWRVIKMLTTEYLRQNHDDEIENMVRKVTPKPGWRRPTDLIAKVIPMTFLLTWIILLILHLLKLLRLLILF
jgi:hypothetical protein